MRDGIGQITPFGLRLPPQIRDQLTKAAQISGRSLNAEILHRLEGSFSEASTEKRLKALESAMRKQGLLK